MAKIMSKSVFSAEEPADDVPVTAEADKKTNSVAATAVREAEKKVMMMTTVTRERQKIMNTYLAAIIRIYKDDLPGKDDRLQIVHKFADHDARNRQ